MIGAGDGDTFILEGWRRASRVVLGYSWQFVEKKDAVMGESDFARVALTPPPIMEMWLAV